MKVFCLVSRENLTRINYVRLGIPKKYVRQATVVDKQGRRQLDLARLAELSGRPFLQVVNCVSRADFPKADLTGVRDRLKKLKLMSGKKIFWKKGLEHPDENVRNEFIIICHALIEKLAANAGVPVFALTQSHFYGDYTKKMPPIQIAELGGGLVGLSEYHMCHPGRGEKERIDFMLERLGYDAFDSLSIEEQVETLKLKKNISWKKVPLETQRWLVEMLAVNAGVSVFALTQAHFHEDKRRKVPPIEVAGLGKCLFGLYRYHERHPGRGENETVDFILERLGYDRFDSLSIEEQVETLKLKKRISWEKVPLATQRYLVEKLAANAGVPVFALTQSHFLGDRRKKIPPIQIAELGRSLCGLYQHYLGHPEGGEKERLDFILERLGYDRFDSLSVEKQLDVLKLKKNVFWRKVSMATRRYLVEKLAANAGVPVFALTQSHFLGDKRPIEVEELWESLCGLHHQYQDHPERGEKETIDFMLERLGYGSPPFNAAGRLFAAGRAEYLSQSMYIQFSTTRWIIDQWRKENPQSSLTDMTGKRISSILKDQKYNGLRRIFEGNSRNWYGLSYIDLICLALQHIPLDEMDPKYRAAHPEAPNYLVPSMFNHYAISSAESYAPAKIVGYYDEKRRDNELDKLAVVLGKRIGALRASNGAATSEGGLFDPKWLETQRRGLTEIAKRIKGGGQLPAPLRYALGLQGRLADTQPKLAAVNDLNSFNPSQQYAIKMILEGSNPFVMVHGPAGSGKTHIVAETVRRLVDSGKRVLYATPTHKAADVFLERVDRDKDLPILRLGLDAARISEVGQKYWVRDREARDEFTQKMRANGKKGSLFVGTIAAGVHFLIDKGAKGTRERLFSEYVGGNLRISRDISNYDVVIIDEASMASKPEVYAALALARRAVIIGDHVQLEPFPVERQVLKELGLNERERESVQRSLLEELMFDNYPHILLDRNYRAINPAMIVLASRIFYDERIRVNQASPYFRIEREERQRRYPKDSLRIIDTSALPYHQKEEVREGTSYSNYREAELAVEETRKLVAEGFRLDEIAFIAPYTAQVNLIKRELARAFPGVSNSYLDRWVSTFDGFQGDENKCVIISFVRSNDKQPPETGFVGNYHRVNVGITRAEERMVLIGDWSTLKKTGSKEQRDEQELSDNLSLHTRHIFEELEEQVGELEREGRAVIIRL